MWPRRCSGAGRGADAAAALLLARGRTRPATRRTRPSTRSRTPATAPRTRRVGGMRRSPSCCDALRRAPAGRAGRLRAAAVRCCRPLLPSTALPVSRPSASSRAWVAYRVIPVTTTLSGRRARGQAAQAGDNIKDSARGVRDSAKDSARGVRDSAGRTADKTDNSARRAADKADHTGHSLAGNVKHAVGSAGHKVEHAASSAKHKLGDAAHSVKHKAGDTAECAPAPAARDLPAPRRPRAGPTEMLPALAPCRTSFSFCSPLTNSRACGAARLMLRAATLRAATLRTSRTTCSAASRTGCRGARTRPTRRRRVARTSSAAWPTPRATPRTRWPTRRARRRPRVSGGSQAAAVSATCAASLVRRCTARAWQPRRTSDPPRVRPHAACLLRLGAAPAQCAMRRAWQPAAVAVRGDLGARLAPVVQEVSPGLGKLTW